MTYTLPLHEITMELLEQASLTLTLLMQTGFTIVTAESCTGGLISAALTAHSGSAQAVLGGLVTYSNTMKENILHVPAKILEEHGAVSQETAKAMAIGAQSVSEADIALSVTGIAGPDGGSEDKPVGLVWIGLAYKTNHVIAYKHMFKGTRSQVRQQTVLAALSYAQNFCKDQFFMK